MKTDNELLDIIIAGSGASIAATLLANFLGNNINTEEKQDQYGNTVFHIDGLIIDKMEAKSSGELLSFYKMKSGLTSMRLADLTGIGYSNIIAMEKNRRVIGLNIAKKLAKALNCKPSDLLPI